eukprot:TRINITY_DN22897_c0_g1_i1.p3 TRINITY_DN22897_c0_g1~~TRINITY_DN22897_c0_g1_i1.p3  ORF type:complete len:106 (+),score=17.53 TRINITY_DN22897_c0_g1_i1:89-406(+)
MIRRPPRSTQGVSSAASDVYKRQVSTQSTWALPSINRFFKDISVKIFLRIKKLSETEFALKKIQAKHTTLKTTKILIMFCKQGTLFNLVVWDNLLKSLLEYLSNI